MQNLPKYLVQQMITYPDDVMLNVTQTNAIYIYNSKVQKGHWDLQKPIAWMMSKHSTVISSTGETTWDNLPSRKGHEVAFNLFPPSPLNHLCLWPITRKGPDNQKTMEWWTIGRKEGSYSRPTTKIGRFSGQSRVSGRQSNGCQLFGKHACNN